MKNRTIMNMVRIMLKSKRLSIEFWIEYVACLVYIMNMSPTKNVKNRVPQESWSHMKWSVLHFKVFRCVAHAHVPGDLRRKVDDKSEKCIFIGYSEKSKAYRL